MKIRVDMKGLIPQDKIMHFLVGLLIASLTAIAFNPAWGILSAAIIGLSKELYDLKRTGFDLRDLLMTAAGGFFYYWIRLVESCIK